MRNAHCFSLVLLALLVASAGLTFADSLDVNIPDASCLHGAICNLEPGINGPGTPAQGSAIFPVLTLAAGPWQINFTTADPTWWSFRGGNYQATFGVGGIVQMIAPGGLAFTGEVTSGAVGFDDTGYEYGSFTFNGQWANNNYASGNLGFLFDLPFSDYASLFVATTSPQSEVPEPASLALLGSGIAGMWMYSGSRPREKNVAG